MRRDTISAEELLSQELLALLEISMLNMRRTAFRYFQSPQDAQQLIHETHDKARKFIASGENLSELSQASAMTCWLFRIMHEVAKSRMID